MICFFYSFYFYYYSFFKKKYKSMKRFHRYSSIISAVLFSPTPAHVTPVLVLHKTVFTVHGTHHMAAGWGRVLSASAHSASVFICDEAFVTVHEAHEEWTLVNKVTISLIS